MKTKIKVNINSSEKLEELYRADRDEFAKAFLDIYDDISENKIADFWKTRIEYDIKKDSLNITDVNESNASVNIVTYKDVMVKSKKNDILFLILSCLISGFLIQIPHLFDINLSDDIFYQRNAGLIFLLGLSIYSFFSKESFKLKHFIISAFIFIISAIYVNFLPNDAESQTVLLVYIHLPLMLWCLYGLIFIDFNTTEKLKRIDYLKYNGDLAVLSAIILITGGILTALTIGLFEAIDIRIEDFYFKYIVITGLVCAPIVATYIIRKYPIIANKIAPIIANIFTPLIFITLIFYLITVSSRTYRSPFSDRTFLIVFNFVLLLVTALVLFSITGTSNYKKQKFNELILLALTVITLIINIITLSAILYRLGEYGLSPNRVAVLGSNILIFINLILVSVDLLKVNLLKKELKIVELTIAKFLPIYALWVFFVVFILPWIFNLK